MRIKWTKLYVSDQEKALQFYTEMLGFQKKADFSQGNYRWLTVASPEDPEGVELILESNANPAGRAYQACAPFELEPSGVSTKNSSAMTAMYASNEKSRNLR